MASDWAKRGNCREGHLDDLFVTGAEQNVAKRVCSGCPVRLDCLVEALDNRIDYGVWGGMTERERRKMLRRHPNVRSWATVLAASRRQIPVKL